MMKAAATATTEFISACHDHEQHATSASLGDVLARARDTRARLATSWSACAQHLVVAEELAAIDAALGRVIAILQGMQQEPERSFRDELAAECAQLHTINDALRELLDHSSALPPLQPILVSVVAATAALHALRQVACRREDARLRWPELPALRVVAQVHLEKIAELCIAELRALSDARFALKRWRPTPAEPRPRYAYVFDNRMHTAPQAMLDAGGDPFVATRDAMAAHKERAFAAVQEVATIHQLTACLVSTGGRNRAAA